MDSRHQADSGAARLLERAARNQDRSFGGRFWIENHLVDEGLVAPLDGRELKVYLVLRRSANRDRVAFAAQVYIAQVLRCSTRTVRRAVAGLRRKGYVEARQPFIKSPNRYYLVPVQKIGGPVVGHQDDREKGGQD